MIVVIAFVCNSLGCLANIFINVYYDIQISKGLNKYYQLYKYPPKELTETSQIKKPI